MKLKLTMRTGMKGGDGWIDLWTKSLDSIIINGDENDVEGGAGWIDV